MGIGKMELDSALDDKLLKEADNDVAKNGNTIEERNVIIIGGGTAGYAAGVYTSRAMLEPLLLVGDALGGQLSLTLDLENYPGYFGHQAGEFVNGLKEQAERFGTETRFEYATEVDFNNHPFSVKCFNSIKIKKCLTSVGSHECQ